MKRFFPPAAASAALAPAASRVATGQLTVRIRVPVTTRGTRIRQGQ